MVDMMSKGVAGFSDVSIRTALKSLAGISPEERGTYTNNSSGPKQGSSFSPTKAFFEQADEYIPTDTSVLRDILKEVMPRGLENYLNNLSQSDLNKFIPNTHAPQAAPQQPQAAPQQPQAAPQKPQAAPVPPPTSNTAGAPTGASTDVTEDPRASAPAKAPDIN